MSGINSLPTGGKNFSASRFQSKLKYLSKNSSALSSLSESDNQKAIAKAVSKYQRAIKSGSFDKSQQSRAVSQINRGAEFNSAQIRTVKNIVSRLGQASIEKNRQSKVVIKKANQDEEIEAPKMAGQAGLSRSRDSRNSSPQEYASASQRPVVSIGQKIDNIKNKDIPSSSSQLGSGSSRISLSR